MTSKVNLQQSSESEVLDGCPTAILIDVPTTSNLYSSDYCMSNCTQQVYKEQAKLDKYKILNVGNQDSKKYLDVNFHLNCKARDFYNSANLYEVQNQISVKRLHWKTPSPESMSCISKEASKVISSLNSSVIFDDDLLLTEEILPIPINFDDLYLDDNDTNENNSSNDEKFFEHKMMNPEKSVNAQSKMNTEGGSKMLNYYSGSPEIHTSFGKLQDNFDEMPLKIKFSKEYSGENDNSKALYSSESHVSAHNSCSATLYGENDDVFIMTPFPSENKENIQKSDNQRVSTTNIKFGSKATSNSSMIKSKFEHRATLRNLSNIKQEASAKYYSFNVNKNVNTSLKNINLSAKKKKTQPLIERPQVKKPQLLVDSHTLKSASQPNTFHFQSTKELISGLQKPYFTMKVDSLGSSLSSNVKQHNISSKMKPPLKSYSVSTPIKCASATKPPLTPAKSTFQNPAIPKCTPQFVRSSRLSFSKSWQQSDCNSQFPAKVFKQQTSTIVPLPTSKVCLKTINSSNQRELSFSQSMSSIPSRSLGKKAASTSSKARFCSKLSLPSPLSVEQDKKLVRALFKTVSGNDK